MPRRTTGNWKNPEKFPFFTEYILTQRKLFVNSFFVFSVQIYRFFTKGRPVAGSRMYIGKFQFAASCVDVVGAGVLDSPRRVSGKRVCRRVGVCARRRHASEQPPEGRLLASRRDADPCEIIVGVCIARPRATTGRPYIHDQTALQIVI